MSSERLSILGKIEAATPEVVVFAVQASALAFDDENETGNAVIEEAIDAAVKAFEDKGATAAAFAQRAIFHGEGEGRLVVEIAREFEQESAESDDGNGDDSGERA